MAVDERFELMKAGRRAEVPRSEGAAFDHYTRPWAASFQAWRADSGMCHGIAGNSRGPQQSVRVLAREVELAALRMLAERPDEMVAEAERFHG